VGLGKESERENGLVIGTFLMYLYLLPSQGDVTLHCPLVTRIIVPCVPILAHFQSSVVLDKMSKLSGFGRYTRPIM
jgi:hypothetical protein